MTSTTSPGPEAFDYDEFTSRNIGFITSEQQQLLRDSRIFVCGVGGMGGACVQSLVRSGVGHLCLADFDSFELSNLNRQPFANLDNVGCDKVTVTREHARRVNPTLELETYGSNWPDRIDRILSRYRIVLNSMDDVRAGILLYRKAREHGAVVIDAYTSTLPSVAVVGPHDPRPEERLGYPTVGIPFEEITEEMAEQCLARELAYVLVHSSTARHVIFDSAIEMLNGNRKRMSFAPMVITSGNLMCYEAVSQTLGTDSATDFRGYFFNPYSNKTERPRSRTAALVLSYFARRYLRSMSARPDRSASDLK